MIADLKNVHDFLKKDHDFGKKMNFKVDISKNGGIKTKKGKSHKNKEKKRGSSYKLPEIV